MKSTLRTTFALCVALSLWTVASFAQTTGTGAIVGRALDSTGAVIPGVEVTITSPQLIGGAHTIVTDEQGVYRFELLRAGTYRVSFALPGFKTINIEDVGVVVNATKTQDGVMQVSASSEEVTVVSESPTIDLEAATIGVNWSQKMIDDLPWSRSLTAISGMIPNALSTSYDVGNSSFGTSSTISARNGGLSGSNMVSMDGLYWCQTYEDYGTYEEMNISTNAKGAEQLNAGITLALTVKSGSNTLHGNLSTAYQNGSMQSNNVTPELISQGYSSGSNKYTHFTDYYGDIGGPIIKDKFWFYGAYRTGYQGTFIPGLVSAVGGTPQVFYTKLVSPTVKLTYQLTQKQKLEAYLALPDKEQPFRNGSALVPGDATYHQLAFYGQGPNFIYTNILDSKTAITAKLTHAGLWQDYAAHSLTSAGKSALVLGVTGVPGLTSQALPSAAFEGMDPGSHKMSVLNDVGAHVSDTTTGAVDGAYSTNYTRQIRWQWNIDGSRVASIAGRANEIKAGYMGWWDLGNHLINYGYPYQEAYVYKSLNTETCPGNSICSNYFLHPNSVVVTNLPSITASGGKYAGSYVNDKITVNRKLTVNVGIRWDHSSSFLPAQGNSGSGPFGSPVTIPYSTSITNPTNYVPGQAGGDVAKFPIYNLFTPRVSFAYALTGDGRLAIKGSYGRYATISSSPGALIGPVNGSSVNPIGTQSCTFNGWNGVIPYVPVFGSQNHLGSPTNSNLASACPPAQTVNGVAVAKGITEFDPNLRSSFVEEFTGGVEIGFSKNYSLRANVSRKFSLGGSKTVNTLLPYSAYTDQVCAADSGKGGTGQNNVCYFTVPSANPNRLLSDVTYTNVNMSTHEGQSSYTAYDVTFNKQYAHKWSFLSGLGLYLIHPSTNDPLTPNQLFTASQNDLAYWTPSFKMNGTYEFPAIPAFLPGPLHKPFGGLLWSGTFTTQKGDWYGRSAQVKDALGTTDTVLMQGHFARYPAVTDWDNRITKRFRINEGRETIELKWDLYNSLNAGTVTSFKSTTSNSSTYLVPSNILPGRIYEWGASIKF